MIVRNLARISTGLLSCSVCAVSVFAQTVFAQTQAYLPLQQGEEWELHSSAVGQPMIFTVENVSGPVARVNWQNPWIKAKFLFRSSGSQVLLDGLDMGSGVAPMPANTTYFDFGANKGARWSNAVGNFNMVATDVTVKTPAGAFTHCIEIGTDDKHGGKQFWFFAPGVGFVQFGEGSSAFLLTRYALKGSAAAIGTAPVLPAPGPSAPMRNGPSKTVVALEGGLYLGLESNPPPSMGVGFAAREACQLQSAKAGSRLIFVGPKWNEVEPSPGQYNFSDIDDRVRLAGETGSAILFNLRVIDTSSKTVPGAYQGWSWDDSRLQAKLTALLRALAPHLQGRARWITIGNEVDSYFPFHTGEIGPYAKMLGAMTPELHRDFPNTPITVNFTSSAEHDLTGRYSGIVAHTDVDSINYYPINADFTFRDPSTVGTELQGIVSSGTGRPIVFQEFGYPSSSQIAASEDKQAQFVDVVLHVLSQNWTKIQAASFNWRSDLPDSVVNELVGYYQQANSGNFRAFLASLGWFRQDNSPKKVWTVFQQEAPAFLPAH